jgi:hypothetical protein
LTRARALRSQPAPADTGEMTQTDGTAVSDARRCTPMIAAASALPVPSDAATGREAVARCLGTVRYRSAVLDVLDGASGADHV